MTYHIRRSYTKYGGFYLSCSEGCLNKKHKKIMHLNDREDIKDECFPSVREIIQLLRTIRKVVKVCSTNESYVLKDK